MALIDKETIRAEIERRMEEYNCTIEKYSSKKKSMKVERDAWKWAECKSLLNFLDTLPEQPELKPMNIPSGGGAMGTTPPSYKLEVKKQPVEGLEDEAESYWIEAGWSKVMTLGRFKTIARHFAEWGAEHGKK